MNTNERTDKRPVWRGELALLIVILINSFGVVLMLDSGAGISAISSVPYAFSESFPTLTLGTWTYIFQGILVAALMILRKKFVPTYLFSFVVGFAFSKMLDVYKTALAGLTMGIGYQIVYFIVSYLVICLGIALSNRCGLPIIPTDLFPREMADILKVPYSSVQTTSEATCLAVTAGLTFCFLGHIKGLGIGTILAAFTMGKVIGMIGNILDKHFRFVSFLTERSKM